MSSVTQRPVKVLLVEDDPEGSGGLRAYLDDSRGVHLDVEPVGELRDGLERLSHGGVDVILLDLALPDSAGMSTFERAHAFAPHVPIIVVTDLDDEELAVATVQGGAQDYLVRGTVEPSEVVRSIRYAIERHRLLSALRSLSLIDELTALYNRRGFLQLGEQYLKLARRSGRGGALLFLDIDRFRTINDGLGHHIGDRALLKMADILRSTVRTSDLMARLVGDEFAVLALESSTESSDGLVGRIQRTLAEFNQRGQHPYRLAASVGLARFPADGQPTVEELLEDSASAMLQTRRERPEGPP
jgi:diguanylate cyclase (GGDEF)-like protein